MEFSVQQDVRVGLRIDSRNSHDMNEVYIFTMNPRLWVISLSFYSRLASLGLVVVTETGRSKLYKNILDNRKFDSYMNPKL
jgi:hypothetical protein